MSKIRLNWQSQDLPSAEFICGVCDHKVASIKGFRGLDHSGQYNSWAYICPNCTELNVFGLSGKWPGVAPGNAVDSLPSDIHALYDEARRAAGAGANTASVLVCRKLLMNISVAQGAAEGLKFIEYVNYLADQNFIPPNGKSWVNYIRTRGNEATHEILLMKPDDAMKLIQFIEMLLKFIYEFPAKVPPVTDP